MRCTLVGALLCVAVAAVTQDDPSVTTSLGVIKGVAENGVEAFKGIRYE
jgi:hypothetical protein